MKLPENISNQIKNDPLSQIVKDNYENNCEFQQLIEKMIIQKFDFNKLEKFKNIIIEYFQTYSLCQQKNELKCKQNIEGYRLYLKFQQNRLFLFLKKCIHKKNSQSILNNYLHCDFPKKWIKSDLKKQVADLDQKDRGILINYFMSILNPTNELKKKWLFLNGSIGAGKTFLSVFFANTFISKTDKKVIFINANNLFTFFRKYTFDKTELIREFYLNLHNVNLLIIDDLGNENRLIAFRDEFLFSLINKRYFRGLLTFFISNLSYSNLKSFYTFSNDKIETTKTKSFFNLFDKNCHFITLNNIFKNKMIK